MDRLEFYQRFFKATRFVTDLFFWRVDNDVIRILSICNDTFYWACSDCEEVTPENIHVLEQSRIDLESDQQYHLYLADLFTARVRGMRPQKPVLESIEDEHVLRLFEACGPEREE